MFVAIQKVTLVLQLKVNLSLKGVELGDHIVEYVAYVNE
jgi:hypothetical protein